MRPIGAEKIPLSNKRIYITMSWLNPTTSPVTYEFKVYELYDSETDYRKLA